MMPLISVIIPFYNHAAFLQRRIESILLQQQAGVNLQLILLDDASTDGTAHLLRQWQQHPAVKAVSINTHNSGSPFLQWQKGLAMAQTEWVWIAEGDDYCDAGFLAALLPALNQPNCVLAYNEIRWVNENDEPIKPGIAQPPKWYDGTAFLEAKMMLQDHLVNAGMVLFRRQAALNLPNTRYTTMKQAGDYLFWVQIAAQGSVYASGQVLACFVRHPKSLSLKQLGTTPALAESLEVQDWMVQQAGVPAKLHRQYFELQLIHLATAARHQAEFQQHWQFWQKAAAERGIRITDWAIHQKAFWAKARHWLRKIQS